MASVPFFLASATKCAETSVTSWKIQREMEHSSSLRCYYPYQSVPCVCLFSHFWGQLCSGGKGYVTSSPPHSLKLREEVKPINAGRDDGPKLIWIWVNRGRFFLLMGQKLYYILILGENDNQNFRKQSLRRHFDVRSSKAFRISFI